MDVCPLSDDQLLSIFFDSINKFGAQLITNDSQMKYFAPSGNKLGHYKIMKIWNTGTRATIEADIQWWINRLRIKGVPQCDWMGNLMGWSTDLVWRTWNVWVSPPCFITGSLPASLDEAVRKWCECLLAQKNAWFRELHKTYINYPDLFFDQPIPVNGGAQATTVPSLPFYTAVTKTQPIDDIQD